MTSKYLDNLVSESMSAVLPHTLSGLSFSKTWVSSSANLKGDSGYPASVYGYVAIIFTGVFKSFDVPESVSNGIEGDITL